MFQEGLGLIWIPHRDRVCENFELLPTGSFILGGSIIRCAYRN